LTVLAVQFGPLIGNFIFYTGGLILGIILEKIYYKYNGRFNLAKKEYRSLLNIATNNDKVVEYQKEQEGFSCEYITKEVMKEVALLHGKYYERSAIVQWVTTNGTDPVDSSRVTIQDIQECHEMQSLVNTFCALEGERKRRMGLMY